MSSFLPSSLSSDADFKRLADLERSSRLENEISQNSKICIQILDFAFSRVPKKSLEENFEEEEKNEKNENFGNSENLEKNENLEKGENSEKDEFGVFVSVVEFLVTRRSQSRESIIKVVKYVLEEKLGEIKNEKKKKKILLCIIRVSEGKIYVEKEYSIAVRKMAEIYLSHSDFSSAAKLLQDVQIEAFGTLDRKYKVEYILFQMRVLMGAGDYVRGLIVSRKINRNKIEDEGFELLKVRFYILMIEYYKHMKEYKEVSKCYKILYDYLKYIENILNDENNILSEEKKERLKKIQRENSKFFFFENFVVFLSVCPLEKEVISLFENLKNYYKKELDANFKLKKIVEGRLSSEISKVNEENMSEFREIGSFREENGEAFGRFRKYCVQHNIYLFSVYFSKVTLKRMAELIEVNVDEIEKEIADMVVKEHIYAKINRLSSVVSFVRPSSHHKVINDLNSDLFSVLKNLEETCHLINKEYLKYKIEN